MIVLNGYSFSKCEALINVWDTTKWSFLKTLKIPLSFTNTKSDKYVTDIKNANNEFLFITTNNPSFLYIVDIYKDMSIVFKFKLENNPTNIEVSMEGLYMVITYKNDFEIWNLISGKKMFHLEYHYQDITCIKFSQDSTFLVSGGQDSMVYVWSFERLLRKPKPSDQVEPIYSWNDHSLPISDIYITNHLPGWKSRVFTISLDHSLKIYDLGFKGTLLHSINFPSSLTKICSNTLNTCMFLGSLKGDIYQLDLQIKKPDMVLNPEKQIPGHSSKIIGLISNSPDCSLISACEKGIIKIWNTLIMACLKTIDTKVNLISCVYINNNLLNTKLGIAEDEKITISATATNFISQSTELNENVVKARHLNDDYKFPHKKSSKRSFYNVSPENMTMHNAKITSSQSINGTDTEKSAVNSKSNANDCSIEHNIYINASFNNTKTPPVKEPASADKEFNYIIKLKPRPLDYFPSTNQHHSTKEDKMDEEVVEYDEVGNILPNIKELLAQNKKLKKQKKKLYVMAMSKLINDL